MALQYRFFCVPVTCAEDVETALNTFLKTVQVITLHRDLNGDVVLEILGPASNAMAKSVEAGQ